MRIGGLRNMWVNFIQQLIRQDIAYYAFCIVLCPDYAGKPISLPHYCKSTIRRHRPTNFACTVVTWEITGKAVCPPPANVKLSDQVVYLLAKHSSQKERHRRWPAASNALEGII